MQLIIVNLSEKSVNYQVVELSTLPKTNMLFP
jgi:hypothetical protein